MKRAIDTTGDLFAEIPQAVAAPVTHLSKVRPMERPQVAKGDIGVIPATYRGDGGVMSIWLHEGYEGDNGVMQTACRGDAAVIPATCSSDGGVMSIGLHEGCEGDNGVMQTACRGDAAVIPATCSGDGGVMSIGLHEGCGGDNEVMPATCRGDEITKKQKKTVITKYGKQAFSQPYLFLMDEEEASDAFGARDPIKKVNEAYRIRRDIANESLDMPLALLGLDIRAGIEKDDRKWNAIFDKAREEISKEISYLRLVVGDKMKVEVDWQLPLRWPYVALRAPDGKRIVETDVLELRAYGVRDASMLWTHILEKQQLMKKMARDYAALTHEAIYLPKAVSKALAGTRSEKFVMTSQIANQINKLQWMTYLGEDTGGAFCPLPYNLYESLRLRHWAVAEAVKNHVMYMNMLYNLVQKETSQQYGTPRRAGLAVRITTGKADIPVTSWALWINHRMKNLFYTTVTPRVRSKSHGKYISGYSFKISDEKGRLMGESIHKAHLSHMADIYRTVDSVLAELQKLADKSGLQMQKIMGYRHAKDSPAAAGKASWRPSGRKLKWLPEQ